MKITKIIVVFLSCIALMACGVKIDSTSEESYKASIEEMQKDLSKSEIDSLGKCMLLMIANSGHTLLEMDKIMKDFDEMTASDIFEAGGKLIEKERLRLVAEKKTADSLREIFVADSIQKYNEQGHWDIKYFLDEFQQPTKDGYIVLVAKGSFSNSATTNSELSGKVIVTSNEEFQLFLYEYGSSPVKTFTDKYSSPDYYSIKIQHGENIIETSGEMYSDRIHTADSKIIDIFKKDGTIKMYLIHSSKYSSPSTYLLEFDATNYHKAIKKLKGDEV